jgi:hypothetical protein
MAAAQAACVPFASGLRRNYRIPPLRRGLLEYCASLCVSITRARRGRRHRRRRRQRSPETPRGRADPGCVPWHGRTPPGPGLAPAERLPNPASNVSSRVAEVPRAGRQVLSRWSIMARSTSVLVTSPCSKAKPIRRIGSVIALCSVSILSLPVKTRPQTHRTSSDAKGGLATALTIPPYFPKKHCSPRTVDAVRLEDVLGDIQPDLVTCIWSVPSL